MNYVLDSSFALAWALPDETSGQADRFFTRIKGEYAFWVPALWWYEIANALIMAQRRRRLSEPDRIRLIELYETLPIQTDILLGADIIRRLHALAQEHNLSAYDTAYLELAQRRGFELATLDRDLIKAARKIGIKHVRA
ncbi:MAG TPA: type II toxin-antitoxin system VapC family toxin [Nitrospiria bacterium]